MPETTDLTTTVAQARKLQASIRTMHRNLRLGRYQGRNRGGDTTYQDRQLGEIFPRLPHRLQGLLTAEHKLAERIAENIEAGNDRPELRARLTHLRREIKELTTHA